MEIITRTQAVEQGLTHYYVGTPCKNGHTALRKTSTYQCIECIRAATTAWEDRNGGSDLRTAKSKKWTAANKEKAAAIRSKSGKKRREFNSEATRAEGQRYRETHRDRIREYNKAYNASNAMLISSIKSRCKRRGLDFDLTVDDIVIPDTCPILGIPLYRSDNVRTNNSPTVDRIDNSKGYTKDNIHVISWRANRLKNDSTFEELKAIVQYLERQRNEKDQNESNLCTS